MSVSFIDQILVFSGGGLISIITFRDNRAEIWINWPEEVALKSMKLVADILNLMHKTGRRVVYNDLWVAYIPERADYIIMAKVKAKRYILPTVGLLRRIAQRLKELPEESSLIGESVVELFREYFNLNISEAIKRWR